jgi:serine/threonine-protein kinase
MGAVFRARDLQLDRPVALKLLPPEQAGDPEVVQRFYQEGRAAAQLDHENIARVYSIGHDPSYHYIAFEYIEGATLRQRVERNGPLPVSEAINYTLQIAGALVHAAERGVVHRDIKPSNIIVTPHERAKLVDMGLARRFERGSDDGLTQSGMTLGTFDYISPEQARDPRDVDVRSDLYSLGCTLFHMLTGRPPFPEGTVLQKLIQHQEEAPPDICALNPQVPRDLANILMKLMAKDRDRRYQTPEQLVRDLLTVAGTLGLRSISPEGLVWMSATAPAAWERHLVWALPALAFAVVMIAMVWWGQDAGSPPLRTSPEGLSLPRLTVQPAPKTQERPRVRDPRELPQPARTSSPGRPGEALDETVPAAPRDIAVDSSEDLLTVLASAPPHAIVVLEDDGPYLLGGESSDRHLPPQLLDRDLTLKADAGVVPTIRLARDPLVGGKTPSALLDLVGGRVTLEGLEFVVDAGELDGTGVDALAAIRTDDTELIVRRCKFHRQGPTDRSPPVQVAALYVRNGTPPAAGDRSPAVLLDACHFDGDQVGVLARGPVEVQLRDCTLGGLRPAVWVKGGKPVPGAGAGPAPEIRLRHLSLLAAPGPVFRFEGLAPRVWIDDSVIAPGRDRDRDRDHDHEVTLIAADDPDALDWRGRGNLYGRIGSYLQPGIPRPPRETIRTFADWAETPLIVRETGSAATQEDVWSEPDPEQALVQESLNPSRVFRLAVTDPAFADVGARSRQGPFGTLTSGPKPAASLASGRRERDRERDRDRDREPRASSANEALALKTSEAPSPMPVAEPRSSEPAPGTTPPAAGSGTPSPSSPGPPAEPDETTPMPPVRMPEMTEMPVMPPMGREGGTSTARPGGGAESTSTPRPDEDETGAATNPASASTAAPAPASPSVSAPDPGVDAATGTGAGSVVRTVDQFVAALSRPGAEGGTLRIAADADWVLSGVQVRSGGRWTVRAEPGPTRPRIRLHPTPAEPRAPTAWSFGIDLRAGTLHGEGIDLILARQDAPAEGRSSALGVTAGTELSLTDCTVTIEGNSNGNGNGVASAALFAQAPEADSGKEALAARAERTPARVELTNCLLRSGGDLVEVAAGGHLLLEIGDAVVATGGSLIHANGLPRGEAVAPVKLTLRQVTARMAGGLIQLESAPGEPQLPLVEISVRDSILATNAQGTPLLQVDGQDELNALQNRIKWDGLRVAYHQINAYRRDQTAQVGTVPKIYNRPDWMVAVGPQEEAPIHGDLKFAQKWNPDQPAWLYRREDFRLAPDSPAASNGADLTRIPPAPPYPW